MGASQKSLPCRLGLLAEAGRSHKPLVEANDLMACEQEDESEEDDHLEAAGEHRDAETFDDAEFYQQLLKEFLEGSAVGSGAGALAASATVSSFSQTLQSDAIPSLSLMTVLSNCHEEALVCHLFLPAGVNVKGMLSHSLMYWDICRPRSGARMWRGEHQRGAS